MLLKRFVLALVLTFLPLCSILTAGTFPVPALPFEPLSYFCRHLEAEISIDGQFTEAAWSSAPWSASFTDIEGSLKPAPHLDTRMKMLWNQTGLFIAARLEEPNLWATLTEHDAVIFWDNDFEVFLDPDGDTHHYFELEMNALGTLWDLFLVMPYRDEHSALNGWEAHGIELAIGLEGTLNDPTDTDTAWQLELFLPWQAVSEMAHTPCPPQPGDHWRINFSRVQWDTEIKDGSYVKVPGKPEHNWVWSPQGLVNMHYPERWGLLRFLGPDEDSQDANPALPAILLAEEYLRQLYYAQKQHWLDHGTYADSCSELGLPPFVQRGGNLFPVLETTSNSFCATLAAEGFPILTITESSRLLRQIPH